VQEITTLLLVTLPNIRQVHFFADILSNKPFLIRIFTTPQNLTYVATLPCNLSLIACFLTLMFSQATCSVAIDIRSGWMFNNQFTANLQRNLTAINFVNRLRFDRIISMSLWPHFFGPRCKICINRPHASSTACWRCGVTVADPGTGSWGDDPSALSPFFVPSLPSFPCPSLPAAVQLRLKSSCGIWGSAVVSGSTYYRRTADRQLPAGDAETARRE